MAVTKEDSDKTPQLEPLNQKLDKTPTLESTELKFEQAPETLSPPQVKKRKTPQSRARELIEEEQKKREEWIDP